jgi:hypothetical protein
MNLAVSRAPAFNGRQAANVLHASGQAIPNNYSVGVPQRRIQTTQPQGKR